MARGRCRSTRSTGNQIDDKVSDALAFSALVVMYLSLVHQASLTPHAGNPEGSHAAPRSVFGIGERGTFSELAYLGESKSSKMAPLQRRPSGGGNRNQIVSPK